MSDEQEQPRRRRKRTQFGVQQRLAADTRRGYVRRWFNDVPGRIRQYNKENDWEHVLGDDKKPVEAIVGKDDAGIPIRAFLMEIPEDYYQEDQAAKQAAIVDPQKMREAQAGEGEYIPDGGNSALR